MLALRTLRAIKLQAGLQQIAFQQWVDVTNWKAEHNPENLPLSLRIRFDIENLTSFPITIKRASFVFGEPLRCTYSLGENTFLSPNSPYKAVVNVSITPEQSANFQSNLIWLTVKGNLYHTGVLARLTKEITHQGFSGVLRCNQSETEFMTEIHMNPTTEQPTDNYT